jgi:hypothetical protein
MEGPTYTYAARIPWAFELVTVLLVCGIRVFDTADSSTVQHRYIILQPWKGFGLVDVPNEPTNCTCQQKPTEDGTSVARECDG